jgi:aminoglycoside phosphotransferase (APT) family kinase protein
VTSLANIEDTARAACSAAGLDSASLSPLHHHATPVYLLSSLDIVVRVSLGDDRARARNAVAVASWLAAQDVPVIAPAPVQQPVETVDASVTFWRYYPQRDGQAPPGAAELGGILRRLHTLDSDPPVQLPQYQPLTHLGAVLARPTRFATEAQAWLEQRRTELLEQYKQLRSDLGVGFIHGDAYPGNTLWDGTRAVLSDLDEVAVGPRELDLINTHQGARMGRSQSERDAFTAAYGWDVTTWDGYPTLRAMRDVHTLASFIERATAGDQTAANEVEHRIATLRAGDTGARWHSA